MSIDFTKVELIDAKTRFVLKRTVIGSRQVFNRKHAVTNQIFAYERKRMEKEKELFPNAVYQTHHIFSDKKTGWDYSSLSEASSHAETQNRVFIPFKQRNKKQWVFSWDEAESSAQNLATKGMQVIEYPIPLTATLEDWKKYKERIKKKLLPSQDLMPLLNILTNEQGFKDIIKYEISESKFIGIHLYELANALEILNLSRLRIANLSVKEGNLCALIIGFNAPRKLAKKFESINSSFVYSMFGFDIFSQEQMSPAQMKAMLNDKDKIQNVFWFYDSTQGNYSTNPEQEIWHGTGLIEFITNKVPVADALNEYQVLIWFSLKFEQDDLNILNDLLLQKADVYDYIRNNKPKWYGFWDKYNDFIPL